MMRLGSLSQFIVVMVLACGTVVAQSIDFYVAPGGNDAWSGSLSEPNAANSDGPKATLQGARDAVRALKGEGTLTGPVRVIVRGGTYYLTEPIVFTPEDSGSFAASITYEAYPGEQPVFSGGRPITGWKQEEKWWTADVPDVRDGKWDFSALWVNGKRRQIARTPNPAHDNGDEPAKTDYLYAAGPVVENGNKSATRFQYRPGDLQPWASLQDSWFVVFHSWETSLLRPKVLDEANSTIEFTGPAVWPFGYWRPDQWYYVENLFEGLDQPGEWYLDRKKGTLYYIPVPGEDMPTVEVVAPVAPKLVALVGKPAEGGFVEYLTFRGLRFCFTEYTIEPQGHSDGQAAASVGAAFEATGARDCLVENCEIGHVGTYGIWFREGSKDNRLVGSELFDLGAGAVRIGEAGNPSSENEAVLRNMVDNCFLHDGGRIFRGAVGVWIGRSSYNTISHNEICDFRYTGVSVGWSWGYEASSANHNIIEYNHIHHMSHGQLSDMGAIYTLGVSPGTILRYNLIHDIMSNPGVSLGLGIYFDEGSTDILAENNVVYNTLSGTFHQHYGRENRVQNNIFAFSHGGQLIRSREEDHISFFFERNIVLFNNGLLLGSTWQNGNYAMDLNCYWDLSGDPVEFSGRSWDEWRGQGKDVRSLVADPMFVSPETADFRLKPDSPALGLGFKPFDISTSGLYGAPEWVNKPKQIPRESFSPPVPPSPTTVMDDFEGTPPDANASSATTLGEEGEARIRVSEETAATGKRSLKFVDAAGLKFRFNPHLVYSPHLRKGIATGSFALRIEPGVEFYHEWRDGKNPYTIGPSIHVTPDGELIASGQPLLVIPAGEWARIEITCGLGKQANGRYDLSVTFPGKEPQRFEGLSCGNPAFNRLDWWGFVSNADASTTFFIDNIALSTH